MRERDVRHDAAAEKRVFRTALGAVEELVNQHDVARLVFFLQRADGADADDPGDAEFFHRPDVGAMIQFAGQDAVAAAVPRQENHVAPGEFAGEQIVRGRAKGRFDLHPFLVGEAFDVVKAGAADDADAMFRHARIFNRETREKKATQIPRTTPKRFHAGTCKLISDAAICFLTTWPSLRVSAVDARVLASFSRLAFRKRLVNLVGMEIFHRILKTAVEGGASDVHLKIGTPVIYRINRELIAVDAPFPTAEWMNKIVEAITPDAFEKEARRGT